MTYISASLVLNRKYGARIRYHGKNYNLQEFNGITEILIAYQD
jgi:hypothetical protein